MADDFTTLALAILEWFKRTYTNPELTAQIESARFVTRDWTGVGFYVHIAVSTDLEPINLDDFGGHWPLDGPFLISDDIKHGGDSLLWGKDGYITCIEMYAYGDSFDEILESFELSCGGPEAANLL